MTAPENDAVGPSEVREVIIIGSGPALLGRLLRLATTVVTSGESYRMREA